MLQFSNSNRVMDAETISKNGASSKSQMSRGNFLRVGFALLVAGFIILSINACSNANAQSGGAKSERWEYAILYLDVRNNEYKTFSDNGLSGSWLKGGNAIMKKFGDEGWELVSASYDGSYNNVYFKRRLP